MNIAIIKHIALNLLQRANGKGDSIKLLGKTAGGVPNLLPNIYSQIFYSDILNETALLWNDFTPDKLTSPDIAAALFSRPFLLFDSGIHKTVSLSA
jgi:hypothetical protein